MLCVLFKAAGQRYAIKALLVDEVTPLTKLSPLPGAPDYVAGVMNLRGEPVPVADLTMILCGRPSRLWSSTRILAVRLDERAQDGAARIQARRAGRLSQAPLVGLLAERAMRAVRIETDQIRAPKAPAAAYLEGVAVTERGIIEILDPTRLLPPELLKRLTEAPEDA